VRQHQGRTLHLLDDIGDRECLARSGDPKQRLMRKPATQAVNQLFNRLRLVARRQVI
jgi:hypothetical protein